MPPILNYISKHYIKYNLGTVLILSSIETPKLETKIINIYTINSNTSIF